MRALMSFEMLETINPPTHCNVPELFNLQQLLWPPQISLWKAFFNINGAWCPWQLPNYACHTVKKTWLIMKSVFCKIFMLNGLIFIPQSGDRCSSKQRSMFELASIVGSIPARWPLHPAYMHTFGITNNYFVIVEQPLSVSVPAVLRSHLLNEPLIANFKWYQDQQVRFRHFFFSP